MANQTDPAPLTLLTFAPMVDSEFSRLLLRHYGVAYHEDDRLFGWVSLMAFVRSGSGRIPLLYGRGLKKTGPRPIAAHFDPLAPADRRLIPDDPETAAQVEADVHLYNDQMAVHTAEFAYYHLLPLRELMTGIFSGPIPPNEAEWVPRVYPLLAAAFGLALKLGPERAATALERIRAMFVKTDERVADGRRFLCGDRLTFGDLALASAAAPLLQPKGYGAKMPAVEILPAKLRDAVRELRTHPTAAFVQRIYAEGVPARRV